jgi:PAS domain S-box-containing protein
MTGGPWPKPVSGIRGRLTFWFVAGTLGAVLVGGAVVYLSGLDSIQGTLGQTYCQIASRIVGQAETRFTDAADRLGRIATDVLTAEVALEGRQIYENRPDEWRVARFRRLTDEWTRASDAGARLAQLHPQLSHRLSVMAGLDEESLIRLSVHDVSGLLLASSAPPEHRVADAQRWYRTVAGATDHFVHMDSAGPDRTLVIATPIWGGVRIAGYAVAEYDFPRFIDPIENIRFGDSGEVALVDYTGVSIGGRPRLYHVQALALRPTQTGLQPSAQPAPGEPYWVGVPGEGAWPLWDRLVCVAPLRSINEMRTALSLPPWAIAVTQSPGESYAALSHSLRSFSLAGLFGILVVGLGGALVAYRLAAPLKELQAGVQRFAEGERDSRVTVQSSDEIGELADEFNHMAERITESENELRAFAQAVEDATDAIVMADPQGSSYYVNPAFETITGYGAGEAHGRNLSFLKSEKTPAVTYAAMRKVIAEGSAWRGELWNRRKNGEDYPVDLSISPIHDEEGRVVSLLGIHRDITLAREYRDALEREVEARTREIAETEGLTAMGRMASMVAHDLRNALSTIKMNLQLLSRQHGEAGKASREHCEMSLEQVAYMEEIMRDMLSFARPERPRLDWHDVEQLLDDAMATMSHSAETQNVEVLPRGWTNLPKVYCDRIKIIEVARNLVENALQAMPDGGRLTIEAMLLFETDIPMIRFEFVDTGEGMDAETRAQAFEPFFTTRGKGTGLGLAIVKRIIGQHGGSIGIDPAQSRGTRIWFTLPTEPMQG